MKTASLTDAEIRALGWDALVEKLGHSGAARFAIQTERGHGDYADQRHAALGKKSVDELLEAMKAARPKRGKPRRS